MLLSEYYVLEVQAVIVNLCPFCLIISNVETKYMEIGRHRGMLVNENIKIVVIPMKK